jgi:hypothetical protein
MPEFHGEIPDNPTVFFIVDPERSEGSPGKSQANRLQIPNTVLHFHIREQ